jgi:hypothetical protein
MPLKIYFYKKKDLFESKTPPTKGTGEWEKEISCNNTGRY